MLYKLLSVLLIIAQSYYEVLHQIFIIDILTSLRTFIMPLCTNRMPHSRLNWKDIFAIKVQTYI